MITKLHSFPGTIPTIVIWKRNAVKFTKNMNLLILTWRKELVPEKKNTKINTWSLRSRFLHHNNRLFQEQYRLNRLKLDQGE